MRIGILTYHFSDNYGALWQAHALREWFRARGHVAEFIPYHPHHVEEGGPLDRPWNPALWRKNATILYMKLSQLQRRLLGDRAMRAGFEAFRRDHLGISGAPLRDVSALKAAVAGCDMLVCGSDQIWNPSIQRGLDPVYFLDIPGAERARKIAYAPSFGRNEIEEARYPDLLRLVRGLHGVSVREESGRAILDRAGFDTEAVEVVPDPTLLLGNFDPMLRDNLAPEDVVFCYALRTDAGVREAAKATGRALGMPVVSARNNRQRWRDIGTGIAPTPVDWLRQLARARAVVSNSFHGVALSIVLNRPFLAVALPGKKAGLNARVLDLLDMAGLQDRLVTTDTLTEAPERLAASIGWMAVNERLASARQAAEAYLEKQLQTTHEYNHE